MLLRVPGGQALQRALPGVLQNPMGQQTAAPALLYAPAAHDKQEAAAVPALELYLPAGQEYTGKVQELAPAGLVAPLGQAVHMALPPVEYEFAAHETIAAGQPLPVE